MHLETVYNIYSDDQISKSQEMETPLVSRIGYSMPTRQRNSVECNACEEPNVKHETLASVKENLIAELCIIQREEHLP